MIALYTLTELIAKPLFAPMPTPQISNATVRYKLVIDNNTFTYQSKLYASCFFEYTKVAVRDIIIIKINSVVELLPDKLYRSF